MSIGFFEESHGVRSMTRLAMAWLLVLTSALVAVTCWYLLHSPDAAVLGAVAAILGALVANGIVAIKHRNGPDDVA